YISLFTFSMLMLVMANNLMQLFFGWEAVGLVSYLLIGFWFRKPTAIHANLKAFLVNRVGDFGFLLGIAAVLMYTGSLHYCDIFARAGALTQIELSPFGTPVTAATLACICLFIGAMGKSAQFPLHVWLPDAMEGPTPVSALIHAATMVAAGVFLVARVFFLLTPEVLLAMIFIGSITAFLGAFSALTQTDIKKVLAYSTISQLGLMMLSMGIGAYETGILHLFTHAFFKAGLFLCAGAILHSLETWQHQNQVHWDAQDMFQMGGLMRHLPVVFVVYIFCAAALVGIPLTAGFLSKDDILAHSFAWATIQGGQWAWAVPMVVLATIFLTALYMGRQFCLIFLGDFAYRDKLHHENPLQEGGWLIKTPLIVLSILSLWVVISWDPLDAQTGWLLHGLDVSLNTFLGEGYQLALFERTHEFHWTAIGLALLLTINGFGLAFWLWRNQEFVKGKQLLHSAALHQLSQEGFYVNQGIFKLWDFVRHLSFNTTFAEKYISTTLGKVWVFLKNLSYKAFYADQAYQSTMSPTLMYLAQLSHRLDKSGLNGLVVGLAKAVVIFAQFVMWLDQYIVDGLVYVAAWLTQAVGRQVRNPMNGKVQNYWLWALSLFILGLWWLMQ
ncbi:MAG TPA: NADH-quinone oxidoreductase subunit L, partial [Microscillaceae bacterium]|nr:NADH-quinone oxidoreductase subunit L [Microscillaceae bacterium]